jgi:hypothetical protein
MSCKSATVPAAVNSINFYQTPLPLSATARWEGKVKGSKSEDLPIQTMPMLSGKKAFGAATIGVAIHLIRKLRLI